MWLKCSLCSKNCFFFTLLSAIFFELPITRTFFDFPWMFELSGVDCMCHFCPWFLTFTHFWDISAISKPVQIHLLCPVDRQGEMPWFMNYSCIRVINTFNTLIGMINGRGLYSCPPLRGTCPKTTNELDLTIFKRLFGGLKNWSVIFSCVKPQNTPKVIAITTCCHYISYQFYGRS